MPQYYTITPTILSDPSNNAFYLTDYDTYKYAFGLFDTIEQAKNYMPMVYYQVAQMTDYPYRQFFDQETGFPITKITTDIIAKPHHTYYVSIHPDTYQVTLYDNDCINKKTKISKPIPITYNPVYDNWKTIFSSSIYIEDDINNGKYKINEFSNEGSEFFAYCTCKQYIKRYLNTPLKPIKHLKQVKSGKSDKSVKHDDIPLRRSPRLASKPKVTYSK